jgi:hypothetical protein
MNITKDIINDLFPLYAANECSSDTRALVEEFLRNNPRDALELQRIMATPIPGLRPPSIRLNEMRALREARRRVRRCSWLLAAAVFFSLSSLAFYSNGRETWWMLRDAPRSAFVYIAIGIVFWTAWALERRRSRVL